MSIRPINGHVLISPVKHESFMASQKETYQEIGIVKALPEGVSAYVVPTAEQHNLMFRVGDKVMFDAWLGKRYPKEGSTTEYYWLIRVQDIVAYEPYEQVPEQSV